jgi:hypothetical protein
MRTGANSTRSCTLYFRQTQAPIKIGVVLGTHSCNLIHNFAVESDRVEHSEEELTGIPSIRRSGYAVCLNHLSL